MAGKSKSKGRRIAASAKTGNYQRSNVGRASIKAKERLTTKAGSKVHNQRNFRSLARAIEFAQSLPPNQMSYIQAHGDYDNSSKYDSKATGFASLSSWSFGNGYNFLTKDIYHNEDAIFKNGKAKSYTVRWRNVDE